MAKSTLLKFPFEYVRVSGLGILFYPIVSLDLKTIFGWKKFDFLVDTGADLTTLPATVLPYLGIEKEGLKESRTVGVGGIEVATWEMSVPLRLGTNEFLVKAAVTQDSSTPFLLGRKDLFEERFSLILDSKDKVTVIKEN
ncbi:hypothetical protein A2721_00035 [Candidatus Gottesmanbacteria bacterium RIFCSPHIGHO2_01_FULL_47_48]|uniref:Peptidase A2 domain-containing protein n=1 Tax=Candidatus Gottesmanbacteria bacterium RIFCSPHIGHO2_01_FULL_47_48 TaxID=1798381 RepID=A0A1F6A447_9BACT|nr:MAG: hypothetical protein A2721_00035 [Candidatus Gottesmanbacteria bacterium RIFCSPHIGHO2_01_FULL_47_48]